MELNITQREMIKFKEKKSSKSNILPSMPHHFILVVDWAVITKYDQIRYAIQKSDEKSEHRGPAIDIVWNREQVQTASVSDNNK